MSTKMLFVVNETVNNIGKVTYGPLYITIR